LISSDLTEVVGLAHRVLVMEKGRIKANLGEADLKEVLGLLLGR
jgi:ABC-type sugar transport system ATPase subunit